jgi:uncharacterized protein YndB with AHSA1/START domain
MGWQKSIKDTYPLPSQEELCLAVDFEVRHNHRQHLLVDINPGYPIVSLEPCIWRRRYPIVDDEDASGISQMPNVLIFDPDFRPWSSSSIRWRSWVIITPPKRDDPIYASGRLMFFSAAKRLRSAPDLINHPARSEVDSGGNGALHFRRKQMIPKIMLVVLAFVAVIVIYAGTKPSTFHVQRSATIKASPEKVFPLINDLRNWPRWAPQDREDPTMKRTFAGAESGPGATSDWSGSGNTGKGRMTIIDSIAPKSVTVAVDWERPFAVRNVNEFRLEPDGSNTRITWSMSGPNLFVMKLMSVFMNMDERMGEHFERGLNDLKTIAEQ